MTDREIDGFGTDTKCRDCKRKANAAYQRKRRAANPTLVRSMNLWRLYKITEQEYDDLRVAQGYRCAICRTHEDAIDINQVGGRPRRDGTMNTRFPLHVDHCHDRDAIRGLLCTHCNRAIGMLRDDPERMRRAAEYIERQPVILIDRDRGRPNSG